MDLVIASVLIIAFEVPLVLRNLQITARIIGIGAGCLVVLALIAVVVLLPTRTFHRVVTVLAGFGVLAFVAMLVFGLLAPSRSDFQQHLPQYTGGVTAAHVAASGKAAFLPVADPADEADVHRAQQEREAEPRRHRLVQHRDGPAHLDDARSERDLRPHPPDSLTASGTSRLTYLETNGILDALLFHALGVVICLVLRARSRAEGVDSSMLFARSHRTRSG